MTTDQATAQKRNSRVRLLMPVLLLSGLCLTQSAAAESGYLQLADLDVSEVRRLKEAGAIMPLESLLQRVRRDYPGRVIEIELEKEDDRYVYELEIVDDNGIVWEIELDARTGELLERERED